MFLKEILQKSIKILAAKKIDSANIDAEILLLFALAQSKNKPRLFINDRAWIIAHNDHNLAKKQEIIFFNLISRRALFEPIAYITGKKEFYGLEFRVNKNVLIPRPETEMIVEESLKKILTLRPASAQQDEQEQGDNEKIVIADIGTGSGAIAIALAHTLAGKKMIRNCRIFASDISSSALNIAKNNAKKHKLQKNIVFKKGNLLKALPKNTKIDYLLANLPYISEKKYQKPANKKMTPVYRLETGYEPKNALLAGNNGLKYLIDLFRQMPGYLAKNAEILLESDPHQIPAIKKLARKYLPKHKITAIKDLRGLNRIIKIGIN